MEDYKDLGWINSGDIPEIKKCVREKHPLSEQDRSMFQHRYTNLVIICHTCKHYWHVDMSD